MAKNELKGKYISGSTVRDQEWNDILNGEPAQRNHTARRNRERANAMNMWTVLFFVVGISLTALILISYLALQSDVRSKVKDISKKQSELYTLKQENDEFETRINSSVDLEEVKRIAITELGMTYASEGQIVNVEAGSDDYVRKFSDIP